MSDSPNPSPYSWKDLRAAIADYGGILGVLVLIGGWAIWGLGLMPLWLTLVLSGAFGMLAALGFIGQFRISRAERFLTLGSLVPPLVGEPKPPVPVKTASNLQFVRAVVQYIDIDNDIIRRISVANRGHFAAIVVFGNEPDAKHSAVSDIESLIATITFDDPANSHVDRGCWMYEKSHVIKLDRGSRKELVLGYNQIRPPKGFVMLENDHVRRESIKIKLLRGNELIADVRLSSTKGVVVTQHHRFKISLQPDLAIHKLGPATP